MSMIASLSYLFAVASILLLAANGEPVADQHVLNLPHEPLQVGELWRFDVGKDSERLNRVLRLAEEHDLDLWHIAHSHVDVYSPGSAGPLLESLRALPHSLVANITSPVHMRPYASTEWDRLPVENTTFHAEYHPLFEIDAFMRELAKQHPDVVKVNNLGHSGTGREMLGLTISRPSKGRLRGKERSDHGSGDDGKLAFVIIGAQHAREWVATATALYLAHALASNASNKHSLSHLLDVYDFYIVPVPNPDGYDYTWETDRFWYKTRQLMGSKNKCFGLDMNRNWGYKWKPRPQGEGLRSTTKPREPVDPCSHWYPGHRPFEAPEVNNIANLIITIPNLIGFIDLRSYGQMLSSPFSYSCTKVPRDAEDQLEAGLGAAQALGQLHGTAMKTGTLCKQLYRAPGNVVDWMYKGAGIKYSYVLHLRDTGTYGFSLPPKWIRPVGEETAEMIKYLAKFIAKKMHRTL
ncbi:putative zn_pept [Lyophyllum shimeji]|uniref:Inactive metallocarboxypeptidase ECM14 n=1 Tax=Lyophyllum shimeji TaxID=47721 RepID=A0A9P3PT35_LYOSH|nr:putative zn_pept [Lyophyllum shimeji]